MTTEPSLRVALVALLAALGIAVSPAWARGQEAPAPVIVTHDLSAHPDVALVVDLPPGTAGDAVALTVFEGGAERPAELVGDGGALELVLVFDTSGSMAGASMTAARAAAVELVDGLPARGRLAIVGFGQHPYLVTPMTDDRDALRSGIASLVAAGETALYDALAVATTQFSASSLARSIVLVSDGGDTASTTTLPEITGLLTGAGVRLFGVHLLTTEAQRAVLDDLAAATSGRVAGVTDPGALSATHAGIVDDVVRQVQVRYRSEAGGPTDVAVRLDPGGVTSAPMVLDLPALAGPAPTVDAAVAVAEPQSVRSLLLGGASMFVALVVWASLLLVRPRRSLLAGARASGGVSRERLKARAGEVVERALERQGRQRALGARLEQAGVPLRPGEYVVVVAATVTLATAIGLLLGGVVLGLVFGALAMLASRVALRSKTGKRRGELERQLPDLLQQLISSLRAGYGVMQAIDAASREMEEPMAGELRRLFTEVQLGRDLTESLRDLAARIDGEDFEWVVQAIEINREVGGELVEVLEAVANTIRARDHLRRQVKTLSAQGRLSARILLAMPFAMAVLLSLINPGYLAPLFGRGAFLLVVGAVLMSVGWVWTRRLVRPQF